MTDQITIESDTNFELVHVYTGDSEEQVPRNVSHVQFDCSASKIRREAFFRCTELCVVDMRNITRLDVVGSWAFFQCCSLRTLKLPQVESIDGYAFSQCHSLALVELPEGLRTIAAGAFAGCHSLTHLALPSTLTQIKTLAFSHCKSLISLEIPKRLKSIGSEAFVGCSDLRNFVAPPDTTVAPNAFRSCWTLISGVFLGEENEFSSLRQSVFVIRALAKRFVNRTLHELCYYRSCCSELCCGADEATVETGTKNCQDIFGMTPFHILALSVKPNLTLFRRLLSCKCGRSLFRDINDNWNKTAIEYLCLNPFFDSRFCRDLILSLLKDRINTLGLNRWRLDMVHSVDKGFGTTEDGDVSKLISVRRLEAKLARYERMEAFSLLELFLWKATITSIENEIVDSQIVPNRMTCKTLSAAETVIPNIVPFLEALDPISN
eukprot:scaffold2816_cov121-Cylindrotheca_fusiformis.AAC.44